MLDFIKLKRLLKLFVLKPNKGVYEQSGYAYICPHGIVASDTKVIFWVGVKPSEDIKALIPIYDQHDISKVIKTDFSTIPIMQSIDIGFYDKYQAILFEKRVKEVQYDVRDIDSLMRVLTAQRLTINFEYLEKINKLLNNKYINTNNIFIKSLEDRGAAKIYITGTIDSFPFILVILAHNINDIELKNTYELIEKFHNSIQ